MGKVIAIDGPSGAGKSTIAKRLAAETGFSYLDTGALYRATALGLVRTGISEKAPDDVIAEALMGIKVEFNDSRTILNGEDVSEQIRTPEAGHYSSVFSARGPVRNFLMPVQRNAALRADLVTEGRDMGTVVFPEAWKKFYLDAKVEARAQRRFDQLRHKGQEISMEQATADVVERDKRDSSRDISPLKVSDDAIMIDSSQMTADEVLSLILREIGIRQ